jgi:hypothetical protein
MRKNQGPYRLLVVAVVGILAADAILWALGRLVVERIGNRAFNLGVDVVTYALYAFFGYLILRATWARKYVDSLLVVAVYGASLGVIDGMLFVIGIVHSNHLTMNVADLVYLAKYGAMYGIVAGGAYSLFQLLLRLFGTEHTDLPPV